MRPIFVHDTPDHGNAKVGRLLIGFKPLQGSLAAAHVIHRTGQEIRRHKTRILNTIRMGMSNARIEATNNKIKLLVK
jgi:transposase